MGFVESIIEALLPLVSYLASLPEADRQAAIDRLRAQAAATHADVDALSGELAALKTEHAAMLAEHHALQRDHAAALVKLGDESLLSEVSGR